MLTACLWFGALVGCLAGLGVFRVRALKCLDYPAHNSGSGEKVHHFIPRLEIQQVQNPSADAFWLRPDQTLFQGDRLDDEVFWCRLFTVLLGYLGAMSIHRVSPTPENNRFPCVSRPDSPFESR